MSIFPTTAQDLGHHDAATPEVLVWQSPFIKVAATLERSAECATLLQDLFPRLLIHELQPPAHQLKLTIPELQLLLPPVSEILSVPFSLGLLGFGLCFADVRFHFFDFLLKAAILFSSVSLQPNNDRLGKSE